jgi:hypothetical protein
MDNPKKPKTGSQPMNLTKLQQQMMSSLPAGGRRNIKIVKTGQEKKMKKVRPEVQRQLMKKLEPKTPGGDVDEFGDLIPESVKKAGHPEAFELGLDKDTTSNTEYQKILRRKRIERAAMMSDPTHPHHDTDDVSQDDIEAADRAARRRKRIGEAMEKQGMLFNITPKQQTTTVVPPVVGDERKRSIDRASKKRMKQIKKYEDLPAPVYGKEAY